MVTAAMDLTSQPFDVASRAAVPASRHKVRHFAVTFVGHEAADDVEWMLAEGLANALLHSLGGVTVTVAVTEKALRVEVRDLGPGLLVARRTDHGRGLAIIEALAARWDLDISEVGTCLWFEVDRKSDT
jgi:anti-sigma regulatory factor (Ser/Thr protein kinase)